MIDQDGEPPNDAEHAGNPDDENPCVDDAPSQTVADRDLRSQAHRNHDALKAMGRSVLASQQLGQHNGLPCTIIVSTTMQELESGQGHAVTGGGTLLPISDVIRMASHSHHYLAIYDKHTREPLHLGRAKRFASPGQRIVLYAQDRGCCWRTLKLPTMPSLSMHSKHGVVRRVMTACSI